MLKIRYSSQSQKFLRRLPPKQQRQVSSKITALRDDPRPHDSASLKGKLKPVAVVLSVEEYECLQRLGDVYWEARCDEDISADDRVEVEEAEKFFLKRLKEAKEPA